MTISIFGNPIVEKDSLLVKMLPKLQKTFPSHTFIYQDPTENLNIPKNEWWILDVAEGIGSITIFDNLAYFEKSKGIGVHDFDLFMELKLRQKIGQLPAIKIIAVPVDCKEKQLISELEKIFQISF